jgi:hypothetical protein
MIAGSDRPHPHHSERTVAHRATAQWQSNVPPVQRQSPAAAAGHGEAEWTESDTESDSESASCGNSASERGVGLELGTIFPTLLS